MTYGLVLDRSQYDYKAGGIVNDFERCNGIYKPKIEVKPTNNVAAYAACGKLLHWLKDKLKFPNEMINIYSDSQLVIKQLRGEWQINKGDYVQIAQKIFEMVGEFNRLQFCWIPEKENVEARSLAFKALKGEKYV